MCGVLHRRCAARSTSPARLDSGRTRAKKAYSFWSTFRSALVIFIGDAAFAGCVGERRLRSASAHCTCCRCYHVRIGQHKVRMYTSHHPDTGSAYEPIMHARTGAQVTSGRQVQLPPWRHARAPLPLTPAWINHFRSVLVKRTHPPPTIVTNRKETQNSTGISLTATPG